MTKSLFKAAEYGDAKATGRLLRRRGAKLYAVDGQGRTPLVIAAERGHSAVVQQLLQEKMDVNHTVKQGNTALIKAAENRRALVVEQLLKAKAAVNQANNHGSTALILAAGTGHIAVIDHLLEASANVNHANRNGDTALMRASEEGHGEAVDKLLKASAIANHANKQGDTALMKAALKGYSTVVGELLPYVSNVDVNHANNSGYTALTNAAQNGYYESVQELLHANAVVNHVGKMGHTALTLASQNGHFLVVQQLLRAYADINHKIEDGSPSLILAATKGHFAVVNQLLEQGARVDLCNNNGDTALFIAVQVRHENIARRLCEAGADPSRKNRDGESPLSLLPEQEDLAKQLRAIGPESHPSKPLEQLWFLAKVSVMTRAELLGALKSSHITSFYSFVMAHNLFLLAVRQGVIGLKEAQSLNGSRDYALEQLYLPGIRLDLSQEQKYVVYRILRYAEKLGFIRDGYSAIVKEFAELRSEIREKDLKVREVLDGLSRRIYQLDHRVNTLEKWKKDACDDLQKLCDGQQQIARDMRNMSTSLNELHDLLRKHQRNRTIAGIIGVCLNMIPIVGGALSGAALAASEFGFGSDIDTLFSTAATGVSELLAVDLSNYRSICEFTKKEFLSMLDPIVQKRFDYAVQHSNFESIPNLHKQMAMVVMRLEKENKKDGMPLISAYEESELLQRFHALASSTQSETLRAKDAIGELHCMLQKRLMKEVNDDAVRQAVILQMDRRTGRLSFESFLMAFSELKKACAECRQPIIPVELVQRFRSAAFPDMGLSTFVAKEILEELIRESGEKDGPSRGLSFTRTREDWTDLQVKALLKKYEVEGEKIQEDGFVQVGMKMLFGDSMVVSKEQLGVLANGNGDRKSWECRLQ